MIIPFQIIVNRLAFVNESWDTGGNSRLNNKKKTQPKTQLQREMVLVNPENANYIYRKTKNKEL